MNSSVILQNFFTFITWNSTHNHLFTSCLCGFFYPGCLVHVEPYDTDSSVTTILPPIKSSRFVCVPARCQDLVLFKGTQCSCLSIYPSMETWFASTLLPFINNAGSIIDIQLPLPVPASRLLGCTLRGGATGSCANSIFFKHLPCCFPYSCILHVYRRCRTVPVSPLLVKTCHFLI